MTATPLEPGGTSEPKLDDGRSRRTLTACLIVAVQGAYPLAAPSRHWLIDVDEVRLGRITGEACRHDRATRRVLSVWLPDPMVSATHAVVRRARNQWTLFDQGSRNGTTINGQRTQEQRLADGDVILLGGVALVFRTVELDRPPTRVDEHADQLYPRGLPRGLWTMSPAFERTVADLVGTAHSAASIAILGETGTGKELAARAIHALSERAGEFVAVNCGELPPELVSNEMFGHEVGAFSGAVTRKEGLVAVAGGGTLFLDEVVELPLTAQAALLRTLQEGEVRPVGATRTRTVDLRVVSATHADPPALVRSGKFREDLWSRLSADVVRLPPLRERREDLGLLLRGILTLHTPAHPRPPLTFEAVAALAHYDWPRNIRQFEQVIGGAVRRAGGEAITLSDLPAELSVRPTSGREQLVDLLRRHRGNTATAAAEKGVSRQAIEKQCKTHAVDYKAFRSSGQMSGENGGQ